MIEERLPGDIFEMIKEIWVSEEMKNLTSQKFERYSGLAPDSMPPTRLESFQKSIRSIITILSINLQDWAVLNVPLQAMMEEGRTTREVILFMEDRVLTRFNTDYAEGKREKKSHAASHCDEVFQPRL